MSASERARAGKGSVELPQITPSTAWIYGSLAFPIAMLGYPLGAYIPRLYATEMGISLTAIGLVIMVAAIFDAVTDPVMGHFSDRWRTRWGRRRPWIVVGLPLWLFAVWMLLNPTFGIGVAYLALFFLMMRASSTLFGLPYSAWGLELSSEYHARTMIQSAREKWVIAGLIASAAMVMFSEELFGRAEASFVLSNISIVVVVMVPFAALLVLLRVPEVPTFNAPPVSMKDGLVRMYHNKLFFRLLMIELLIAGGENFRNTLSLLFIQDYIGLPAVGRALLVYFGAGLLAIPVWDWIAGRFGKHRSLAAAMVLVGFVSLAVLTVREGELPKFYVLFALKGFCFGAFAYCHAPCWPTWSTWTRSAPALPDRQAISQSTASSPSAQPLSAACRCRSSPMSATRLSQAQYTAPGSSCGWALSTASFQLPCSFSPSTYASPGH